MEKVEIEKRIENARSVKESRNQLLQLIKEENRKEWQSIKDSCEKLYVFRSDNDVFADFKARAAASYVRKDVGDRSEALAHCRVYDL